MSERKKSVTLNDIDADFIEKLCARIARGTAKTTVLKSMGVNYNSFSAWLKKGQNGTHPNAVMLFEKYREAVQVSIGNLERQIKTRPTKKIVKKDPKTKEVKEIVEIWDVKSLSTARTHKLEELAELEVEETQAGTPTADAGALRSIAQRIEREHLAKKEEESFKD